MSFLELFPFNGSQTHLAPPCFTKQFFFYQSNVAFAVGVPLTFLLMYISFFSKLIKHNYKYLLGNLALCDFFFLCAVQFSNLVHLYVSSNGEKYTPLSCTIYRIGMYAAGASMLCAIPLVSIDRYVVIVLGKEQIFTNRRIFYMCISAYIFPILYLILTLLFPVRLVFDIHCGYMYWFWYVRELMIMPITILTLLSVFCVARLYLYLAKHIKSVSGTLELSRMKDERSLLRVVTMQGKLEINFINI